MAEAKPKLNNLQKHLIIQLLGAYYTINETLDILKVATESIQGRKNGF